MVETKKRNFADKSGIVSLQRNQIESDLPRLIELSRGRYGSAESAGIVEKPKEIKEKEAASATP